MQPVTASAANPSEDIEAVLGRFQAWSASRKPAGNTSPRTNGLPEGVRELSYEEALESSRDRWQARMQSFARDEHRDGIPAPAQQNAPTAQVSAPECPLPECPRDDQILPDKLSLSSVNFINNGGLSTPAIDRPESMPSTFSTALVEALPVDGDPAALALVWPASSKNERQVSMSLRVAASEQALIKARAAEAGLSVSAYLRQCALEVEKLRAQVHHTLALLEQRSEQRSEQHPVRSLAGGMPPQIPSAGFFARLRQRILGSPARVTLRA